MLLIIVTSRVSAKPGMRDKFIEAAAPCIMRTREEKGNLRYELYVSAEDKTSLFFFEEWESMDALQTHAKSPHLATFREMRSACVDGDSEIRVFDSREVKFG